MIHFYQENPNINPFATFGVKKNLKISNREKVFALSYKQLNKNPIVKFSEEENVQTW